MTYRYDDEQVWDALKHCHLRDVVFDFQDKLQHEIKEEGANLSVGQCQLVCLGICLC